MSRLGHKLYPELSRLSASSQRAEVFHDAQRSLFRSPRAWFVAGPVTAFVVWLLTLGRTAVEQSTAIPTFLIQLGMVLALLGYVFVVSTFVFVRFIRRTIREDLCRRGVPVCLNCGFDTHAQTEPRCPECGLAFSITGNGTAIKGKVPEV